MTSNLQLLKDGRITPLQQWCFFVNSEFIIDAIEEVQIRLLDRAYSFRGVYTVFSPAKSSLIASIFLHWAIFPQHSSSTLFWEIGDNCFEGCFFRISHFYSWRQLHPIDFWAVILQVGSVHAPFIAAAICWKALPRVV